MMTDKQSVGPFDSNEFDEWAHSSLTMEQHQIVTCYVSYLRAQLAAVNERADRAEAELAAARRDKETQLNKCPCCGKDYDEKTGFFDCGSWMEGERFKPQCEFTTIREQAEAYQDSLVKKLHERAEKAEAERDALQEANATLGRSLEISTKRAEEAERCKPEPLICTREHPEICRW